MTKGTKVVAEENAITTKGTAVVTGGNGGIGSAIVRALAASGFRVAIFYYDNEASAHALAEEVSGKAIYADLTDEQSIQSAVEMTSQHFGATVTVLVNNAGIQERVPFLDMSVAQFDGMISANLRSAFLMIRSFAPQMVEAGHGKIINITSQTALIGRSEMAHYTAAKGGLISLTKSLARELAPHGVLVNAVAPGPITSGPRLSGDEERNAYMASIPLQRFGTPEEVAETVRFLADGGNYYTGQILSPSGGEVM